MDSSQSPIRPEKQLSQLEQEIERLEVDILDTEQEINAFAQLIRGHLHEQIRLLNELTARYKAHKKAKKEKRLEQKKRGKNYQQPTFVLADKNARMSAYGLSPARNEELKRLYREAIVRVHPDKFATGEAESAARATEVTGRLISLYQAGELEALRDYHEYILSGNAMAYAPFSRTNAPDPDNLLSYLRKKRDELRQRLHELKTSRLYEVLTTYTEPDLFIEELRQAYAERILTFQKRTRKLPGGPLHQ